MPSSESLPTPTTARPEQVLAALLQCLQQGEAGVVATVLRRRGSAPSTAGQKLALLGVSGRGTRALGTVGGGAVERAVLLAMQQALLEGRREPWVERYELGASIGMCCGGAVEILLEPMQPSLNVLLIGAGHVGSAVAPLLAGLGFRVVVCDAREAQVALLSEQDPTLEIYCADHDDPEIEQALSGDNKAAAMVVMTHDHQLDQRVIEWALKRGFAFVGGVGSRAKAARTRARLEAKDFPAEDIERIEMPVGDDIGARLPAEIAVSIAAQLIRWRAARLGQSRQARQPRQNG